MGKRDYMHREDIEMISLIKNRLESYSGRAVDSPSDTSAGVLIPIFEKDKEIHILLTKRTHKVKVHKGEVSFPGGTWEVGDKDCMDTALRETEEELGILRQDIHVIGKLDDMVTMSGFVVSPYVGIIPYPYPFRLNIDEVAYTIFLPLNYLLNEEPACEIAEYEGRYETVPSFYFNKDRIWGATCRMLIKFKNIITDETVQS